MYRSISIRLTKLLASSVAIVSFATTAYADPPLFVTTGAGNILEYTAPNTYTVFASGLVNPGGIAVDRSGAVFVGDNETGQIRKYSAPDTYTLYGTVDHPVAMAISASGNLFVTSGVSNGSVLEFTGANTYSVYGSGLNIPAGIAFDSHQNLFVSNAGDGSITKFTAPNASTTFASGIQTVRMISFDSSDRLYVAENNANGDVRVISPSGQSSYFVSPSVYFPYGVSVSPSDVVYVSDPWGIRTYAAADTPSVYASGLFYPNNMAWQPAPVPEPETYAMLLAGLGLIGVVGRRRATKPIV